MIAGRVIGLGLLVLALFACMDRRAEISTGEGDALFREKKYDEALAKYEEARKVAPDRPEIRFKLSDVYFEMAKKALDGKDEKAYAELLGKAQEAAIAGLEFDPDNASGHVRLGIIAAYRSDMDAARESFEIARQLDPVNPLHYVNLAEVSVYRGKLSQARRYIEKGRRLGANPAFLELDEMLAAWRAGDFIEAEDLFENLVKLNPDLIKNQYDAENIETFEQFTAECCSDIACGPFMKTACAAANQRVVERKLLQETLAQQIALEKERSQRMSKVYDRLRELNIEVEEKESDVNLDDVEEPPPGQNPNDPRNPRGPAGQQRPRGRGPQPFPR
jgi:tetratricopeptide (TPR) repeat protein